MTDTPQVEIEQPPQFTPEFWLKRTRSVVKAKIAKINHSKDGAVTEIVLTTGMAFARKRAEITALLLPGLDIEIEVIAGGNGQIITGLFVPGVGWGFRMSAEDLAEYTQKLAKSEAQRHRNMREQMAVVLAQRLIDGLTHLGITFDDEDAKMQAGMFLAVEAIKALTEGPK